MDVEILGYGIYIPQCRIKVAEIASIWGKAATAIERSLGVKEKSVAAQDEDTVTMSFEAASLALQRACLPPSAVDICFVGSESHPYAVNPTSTIVAEFLGVGRNYLSVDLEFACKAATAGVIAAAGLISSRKAQTAIVIGADTAQAKPHDILEYTSASAACALVLGRDKNESLANLVEFTSYSSDTPDFWRRDGVRFPSHGGRFTGEPAYFTHVEAAAKTLLGKTKMRPSEFDYCVFHMPNGKFPREVAQRLGFHEVQLAPSLTVETIGNPYSASSLLGLSAVLDIARPGQLIFMVSYGSGAGSDGFIFKTSKHIGKRRKLVPTFSDCVKDKRYISYIQQLKYRGRI